MRKAARRRLAFRAAKGNLGRMSAIRLILIAALFLSVPVFVGTVYLGLTTAFEMFGAIGMAAASGGTVIAALGIASLIDNRR